MALVSRTARLLEFRQLSPQTRHFVFDVPETETLEYEPGQFVSFSMECNGKSVTRAYSIASPPGGNRFDLCLNLVEEGLLSPRLFALKPGDTVAMKGPLGGFTLRPSAEASVFVASGTGVAPFRAMIPAALAAAPSREATLLFGTRYESGILYGDEFSDLARRDARFRFWPTLTRAQAEWPGRRGRVQEHLAEVCAGRRDLTAYVCGLKAMVDDVRAMLRGMGFERSQVRYEKYD